MQNTKAGSIQIEQIKVGILVHNEKKTCSGKIPEPKKDENLILDLLGYYDIKEVITDIARKEADLDTLKAGASLIPAANEVMNGDLFLEYDEKYREKEE